MPLATPQELRAFVLPLCNCSAAAIALTALATRQRRAGKRNGPGLQPVKRMTLQAFAARRLAASYKAMSLLPMLRRPPTKPKQLASQVRESTLGSATVQQCMTLDKCYGVHRRLYQCEISAGSCGCGSEHLCESSKTAAGKVRGARRRA